MTVAEKTHLINVFIGMVNEMDKHNHTPMCIITMENSPSKQKIEGGVCWIAERTFENWALAQQALIKSADPSMAEKRILVQVNDPLNNKN